MDRLRNLLILLAALSLAFGVAGCNTGTEEPDAPTPDAPPMREADPAATTGTPEPSDPSAALGDPSDIAPERFPKLSEGAVAAIPENFPSDLPVYPGAVPAQGKNASMEGREMAALQLLINDPPDKALAFYRDQLSATGWTIEKVDDLGGKGGISVVKGGCKASYIFSPSSDGGTDIFAISDCGDEG